MQRQSVVFKHELFSSNALDLEFFAVYTSLKSIRIPKIINTLFALTVGSMIANAKKSVYNILGTVRSGLGSAADAT